MYSPHMQSAKCGVGLHSNPQVLGPFLYQESRDMVLPAGTKCDLFSFLTGTDDSLFSNSTPNLAVAVASAFKLFNEVVLVY